MIVGIFDFLRTVEVSRIDPKWAAPTTSATGYAFAALFYFIFCYRDVPLRQERGGTARQERPSLNRRLNGTEYHE